jgi:SAM-dependent methyltransferase
MADPASTEYLERLSAEGRKWGDHLHVEAAGQLTGWLDHPSIKAHYFERSLVEGVSWHEWLSRHFGGPAHRSLELGCGSGTLSLRLVKFGATREIDGIDASPERVEKAEHHRREKGIPGAFRVGDVNEARLEPGRYDLIFSAHSFHHFLNLEEILEQVGRALTPRGLFILEEFVGPTQFQWTDAQIDVTRSLTALIPERYRKLPWNVVKPYEGRPAVEDVVAVSPFESIRSAEIVPLFERRFRVIHRRNLGGTVQHLLYNGIMHNFPPGEPDAEAIVRAIWMVEDALVDAALLPSDFQLLIGQRL